MRRACCRLACKRSFSPSSRTRRIALPMASNAMRNNETSDQYASAPAGTVSKPRISSRCPLTAVTHSQPPTPASSSRFIVSSGWAALTLGI